MDPREMKQKMFRNLKAYLAGADVKDVHERMNPKPPPPADAPEPEMEEPAEAPEALEDLDPEMLAKALAMMSEKDEHGESKAPGGMMGH